MNIPCPFCRKDVDTLAKICPYCTSQLEGTPEWEKTKTSHMKLAGIIVIVLVALVFGGWLIKAVSSISFSSSSEKPDDDFDTLMLSLNKNPAIYEFTKDNLEADILKKALENGGIDCVIIRGKIYPFESGGGFDSDIYCANGSLHQVNFSRKRAKNLFVDSTPVPSPPGWR